MDPIPEEETSSNNNGNENQISKSQPDIPTKKELLIQVQNIER